MKEEEKIQITLNGKVRSFEAGASLSALLETLELRPDRVAIEVNRQIIKRDHWQSHIVRDGDSIEVVHFVGGGSETS